MNSYGKDKVLFGTNFPQLGLDRCAQQALELKLRPEAQAAFLYGNARRVFGLDAPS
jgi:predicted TIM-barrel fold metal-dependent hydrolase